jgi:hypothetical protein
MSDQLRDGVLSTLEGCFGEVPHQMGEPPGVIQVAMREDYVIEVQEADPHSLGIPDKGIGIPCVEEYPFSIGVQENGEPWFTDKIPVGKSRIIDKDGERQ